MSEAFEFKALFQLRIYALILWRSRGVVPRMLQLVYLGSTSEIVRYEPDEADLLATERQVGRALGGDRARQGDRRVPAQARQAVRLVLVQGALPRPAAARPSCRCRRGSVR